MQIVIHKDYEVQFGFNDISALRTTSLIHFGPSVGKVKLPKLFATRPPVGTTLRVSGWGLREGRKQPTFLRAVNIELLDFDECKYYYRCEYQYCIP